MVFGSDNLNGISNLSFESLLEDNKDFWSDSSFETGNNFVENKEESKEKKIQLDDWDGKTSSKEEISNNNETLTESQQRVEIFLETAFTLLKEPTPSNLVWFNVKLSQIYNNPEDLNNLLENKKLQNNIKNISSMDQKRKMINMILKPSKLDFNQRNTFINNILPTRKERKSFIKTVIKSTESVGSDQEKIRIRKELSNYFLVYELVDTFKPTYSWNSWDKEKDLNTRQFFLKKAGINEKYDESNANHNEAIRDWFLGTMMSIVSITEKWFKSNELDTDHQLYLQNFCIKQKIGEKKQIAIINWLNILASEEKLNQKGISNKDKINSLSEEDFNMFLLGLINSWKDKKDSRKQDFDLKDKPSSILWLASAFSETTKTLDNLLSENKLSTEVEKWEVISAAETAYYRLLKTSESKKNFDENKKIIKNEEWEIEKILFIEEGKEQVVFDANDVVKNRWYELEVKRQRLRALNNPEVNKQLDNIEYRLREAYKNTGNEDELKYLRWNEYYTQVEQNYINTQTIESKLTTFDIAVKIPKESQEDWNKFWGRILENEILNQEENQLQEIPNVSQKDFQNFKTVPSEYQKFIGSNGLFDKNLMDQENIHPEKQQELLNTYNPEKTKNQLLQETNDTIKTQFTQQVVQFLQQSLDVKIDDQLKENILEQFNDIQNNVDNQNIMIEWNYQWQKIRFVYDLTTWDLQTNDWMSKDRRESNLKINSSSSKSLGIFGPNIKDTIANAKTINYADIIQKSEWNIEKYTQYYKQELSLKNSIPHIENQDVLKKQYLKTILNQEMIDVIGLQKPEQQKEIDLNKYPIYNQIYQSVENYDIEELQEMRENLKQMKQLEDQITWLSENDELLAQETDNPAKKILLILFKEQKLEQQKTPINRFWNHFLHFFNAMQILRPRGEERIKIIDPRKIKTFLADVQESGAWERYPYDKEILKNEMSSYLADVDLDKELENIG